MAARQFILRKNPLKLFQNYLLVEARFFHCSRRVEVCCPLLYRVSTSAPTSPLAHQLPKATSNSTEQKVVTHFTLFMPERYFHVLPHGFLHCLKKYLKNHITLSGQFDQESLLANNVSYLQICLFFFPAPSSLLW